MSSVLYRKDGARMPSSSPLSVTPSALVLGTIPVSGYHIMIESLFTTASRTAF